MSIKFLVLGGVFWVRGGRECRFYFYGRGAFSESHYFFFRRRLEVFLVGPYEFPPKFVWTNGAQINSTLMGSLAKGFLRKVCGNSAESSRKFAENTF